MKKLRVPRSKVTWPAWSISKGRFTAFLHYCAKCRRAVVLSGRITTPRCCAINYALDGENCSEKAERREEKVGDTMKGERKGLEVSEGVSENLCRRHENVYGHVNIYVSAFAIRRARDWESQYDTCVTIRSFCHRSRYDFARRLTTCRNTRFTFATIETRKTKISFSL